MLEDKNQLITGLKAICSRAGDAILEVYQQPELWQTQQKSDASPVTAADLAAHQIISQGLQALTPELPLLSEEAADIPWEERRLWSTYWLADPLDGTKEFLDRNDEFTVNIALIEQGQASLGIIYQPTTACFWWGDRQLGAWKQTATAEPERIQVRPLKGQQLHLLTSHRHGLDKLQPVLTALRHQKLLLESSPLGSSLKFCRLAEGLADFYPRLGPTGEWDTAAAQAILEAAGGQLLNWQLEPLTYNQKPELINPDFVALADPSQPWHQWLKAFT
ncbi:3'(2'), 5'-bisphosphate nucleotidase [Marinospirillum celere]|uniref:3'(2'),5'-bisphosphate nucleotidase CysQ n=1 Tax=Marinospirillum celere TaxID=1122252 RepID=A0A1I1FR25_9GAMM|nr:3'(2'),5'-bisphosphate nucleotidase CysQ [Marinospirillum celere]SFC00058.1 3'(2'), 5'-bisphosphate nucleotidase [Marinospirillum celere]